MRQGEDSARRGNLAAARERRRHRRALANEKPPSSSSSERRNAGGGGGGSVGLSFCLVHARRFLARARSRPPQVGRGEGCLSLMEGLWAGGGLLPWGRDEDGGRGKQVGEFGVKWGQQGGGKNRGSEWITSSCGERGLENVGG